MDGDEELVLTDDEAQALHERRQIEGPEDHYGSCWCCCWDCDFDFDAVMERPAKEAGRIDLHDVIESFGENSASPGVAVLQLGGDGGAGRDGL